jgi:hypothetical protein
MAAPTLSGPAGQQGADLMMSVPANIDRVESF